MTAKSPKAKSSAKPRKKREVEYPVRPSFDNDYEGKKVSRMRPHVIKDQAISLDAVRKNDYAKEPDANREYPTFRQIIQDAAAGKVQVAGSIHMLERARGGKGYSGQVTKRNFTSASFKEAAKAIVTGESTLRESDPFGTNVISPNANIVDAMGGEYAPVIGGAYYRQLYPTDFIKQANLAFFAANHDPFGKACIEIMREFTLGRGFRVDCDDKVALALWRAFEKANRLQEQMEQFAREVGIYGESMWYKLPKGQGTISFDPTKGTMPKPAEIPRVRLLDPTNFYDIVTAPEDIYNVQYYVWAATTQWQTYTGLRGNQQPSTKWIFQTFTPDQMLHYKVNAVSNEKRGRSDIFPILGFLKRLRDAVDYAVIGDMKMAAWAIDTTVDGDQTDIDNYAEAQRQIGTIAPAGSEFIHTTKVKREYMAPSGNSAGTRVSFEWVLSMLAAGTRIPVSYFGTHLSGGQTRASALVSTEPFAKKCEIRQELYKRVIQDLWDYCMECFGVKDVTCEITLPEIATADRTAKIKDVDAANQRGYISKRRAANIVAKELGIENYDFKKEQEEIAAAKPTFDDPLTRPGEMGAGLAPNPGGAFQAGAQPPGSKSSSQEKKQQKAAGMGPMNQLSGTEKEGIKSDDKKG